jgi:hypothetical protein
VAIGVHIGWEATWYGNNKMIICTLGNNVRNVQNKKCVLMGLNYPMHKIGILPSERSQLDLTLL